MFALNLRFTQTCTLNFREFRELIFHTYGSVYLSWTVCVWHVSVFLWIGTEAGPAVYWAGREGEGSAGEGGQEADELGGGALQHCSQQNTGLVLTHKNVSKTLLQKVYESSPGTMLLIISAIFCLWIILFTYFDLISLIWNFSKFKLSYWSLISCLMHTMFFQTDVIFTSLKCLFSGSGALWSQQWSLWLQSAVTTEYQPTVFQHFPRLQQSSHLRAQSPSSMETEPLYQDAGNPELNLSRTATN